MHPLSLLPALSATGLLLLGGCADPTPEPLSLTIGVHLVELESPPGWEHLDHGREQRFESDSSQISMADLGPVTSDGFVREILQARELYRRGQLDDSRAQLAELRLRPLFPSVQRWRSFTRPWNSIRLAGVGHHSEDPDLVESAYSEVLGEIEALPQPNLPALAISALASLGHEEQRHDVASQEAMAVSGRAALVVDTWDRLSHAQRKSHLFVLNKGNLLVTRMELGRFPEMKPAFDALVASLRVLPPPAG